MTFKDLEIGSLFMSVPSNKEAIDSAIERQNSKYALKDFDYTPYFTVHKKYSEDLAVHYGHMRHQELTAFSDRMGCAVSFWYPTSEVELVVL